MQLGSQAMARQLSCQLACGPKGGHENTYTQDAFITWDSSAPIPWRGKGVERVRCGRLDPHRRVSGAEYS